MKRIKQRIKDKLRKITETYEVIQNINLDFINKNQKRVLISYITIANSTNFNSKEIFHTNVIECEQIVRWFIKNDYIIDLVYCLSDITKYPNIINKKYDVIFGFGKVFDYMKTINKGAKKILYVTENDYETSVDNEKKRIEYFKERRGKEIKLTRSGTYFTEESFKNIDILISLGEPKLFEKYKCKKFFLSPSGLKNKNYILSERNFKESRKNFIWFGSNGAIHKGLDILIDAVNNLSNVKLHIFGLNKNDKKILNVVNNENIKIHSKINVNSNEFINIVNKCSYCIMPSCSEAKSTAILTCMRHGLIPIVTDTMGFNEFDKFMNIIDDFSVENIRSIMKNFAEKDEVWLKNEHKKVYSMSNSIFTLENYNTNINNILNQCLGGEE